MPTKKDEVTTEEKVEAVKEKKVVAKKEDTTKKTEKKVEKKEKTEKKEVKVEKSVAKAKTDPKHWQYFEWVEVKCICGETTLINTTIPGPIRVETCSKCHPVYNKDKVIKQVIKGRMEKFLEKQKRMESMKK